MSRRITAFAFGILVAGSSFAHPSLSPHPHNADTVEWQINWFPDLFIGAPDGNAAHNHRTARSFGGFGQEFHPPYNAYACWDDISPRLGFLVKFDKGHCFIDEFNLATPVPTYTFDNAGSMPNEARNRIRDAFDEYSDIPSIFGDERLGIEFDETNDGFHDIEVLWAVDPAGTFYGEYDYFNRHLTMDASVDWSFEKDKSDVPAGKWHFYSVALHEVGHVVGFAHQSDSNDVMTPIVGGPANAGGRQFDHLDIDTIAGVYDLYSQSVAPPPVEDCEINFTPICGDPYSNQISVTLGGFTITNMDIDFQVGTSGTGPWNDLYEGSGQTCPGFMSPLINTIRALLTTTQGVSQCNAVVFPVYQSPDCDSPGGGIFN